MDPIEHSIRLRGAVHIVSQFLQAGEYQFRIVSPFDTQMIVSAENPVPGLSFVGQDAKPNVFNAMLKVPKGRAVRVQNRAGQPCCSGRVADLVCPSGCGFRWLIRFRRKQYKWPGSTISGLGISL